MPAEKGIAAAPDPATDDAELRLGLHLAPVTEGGGQSQALGQGQSGVLVARVERGSAAERAGIRPGNLITMVGQQEVSTPEQAASSVRGALASGDRVVLLRIEQDGEARFVAVEPAA